MLRKGSIARKRISYILIFIIILSNSMMPTTIQASPSINTYAEASTLIDVESGRILMSHQGDQQMLIASLTKIMTAIVAIEHGNLSDRVTVSNRAAGKEGSSIYLQVDEVMSLHNLLYGLMMRSGNDAATAIAEHVGGSVEGFAFLMNQKAEEIGMSNSHFVNPHGLNADEHYSTSNDMAKLTAYALQNQTFKEIAKTKIKKVPNPHEKWDYIWHNKNKMLSLFEGADGVKTGYTKKAGRCLVSSATRNGQQLVVVTLNDGNDWLDHANWLDYGFEQYPMRTLVQWDEAIEGTPYVAGRGFQYPLTKEEFEQVTMKVEQIDPKSLNYRLGERGLLRFALQDLTIGTIHMFEEDSPLLRRSQSAFVFTDHHLQYKDANFMNLFQTVLKALFQVNSK